MSHAGCERSPDALWPGVPAEPWYAWRWQRITPAVRAILRRLVRHRDRRYDLFHRDLARGAGHCRPLIATGIGIVEALRGHRSGIAVRTFAGSVGTYVERERATARDPANRPHCVGATAIGVATLLLGPGERIAPERWHPERGT